MLVLIKVNVLNCKTVKKHLVHKYVQVLVAENLSFHNVRLLGHNGTGKPVKVPILSLALLAAVAGKLTARTTFKVLSFFGWMFTVRTNVANIVNAYTNWCASSIFSELKVFLHNTFLNEGTQILNNSKYFTSLCSLAESYKRDAL